MVSKIWVGMSTYNIHLLQFKIPGHLKNLQDFECRCIKIHFEEKNSLIFNIPFATLLFLMKILHVTCYPDCTLEPIFRVKTIKLILKWFMLAQIM